MSVFDLNNERGILILDPFRVEVVQSVSIHLANHCLMLLDTADFAKGL